MNKRTCLQDVAAVSLILPVVSAFAAAQPAAAVERPNILFVVVDDLGWSDTQALTKSSSRYVTPNIQRIARQGMVFTEAYAAASICSPTRASLLTGKSPAALKLTAHIPGNPDAVRGRTPKDAMVLPAASLNFLPLEEVTFAELLRQDGYQAAYFGKWHLAGSGSVLQKDKKGAMLPKFHPDHQGFDVNVGGCAYGLPPSYFSPYLNATISDGPEGEYLTDRLTDEAISYMKAHRDRPFLVYLNYYSVHRPHEPKPELVDVSYGELADYAAMIQAVDQNVGRLMDSLRSEGLEDDMLVILTSDNGGLEGNAPLRGGKGGLWEGGIRVPLMVRWPGIIPSDSRCSEPVISYDFLPTLLDAISSQQQVPDAIEGVSLMPLLRDEAGFKRTQPLVWYFPHYHHDGDMSSALRDGSWKLVYSYATQTMVLFDLECDPYEQKDLAGQFPEKAADLKQQLFLYLEQVDAVMPSAAE